MHTFLLFVLVLLLPTNVAHALPPPEILLSIPQALLSAFGAITATVLIGFGSLRIYTRRFASSPFFEPTIKILGFFSVTLFIITTILYINNYRLDEFRNNARMEIDELWKQYEPIYNSTNEKDAANEFTGAAEQVTWNEFIDAVEGQEYLVIDIRDKHAFNAGRIKGSKHYRLADLIRGRWKELEDFRDKPIYIVCYLGSTGAIASNFLAKQGFEQLYQPKNGLLPSLRIDMNIPFIGKTHPDNQPQISSRLNLDAALDVRSSIHTQVIDVRSPIYYDEQQPIRTDTQMFRELMTVEEIDSFISSLDKANTFMMLCNSDASCYQAGLLTLDLSDAGLTSSGVYDTTTPEGRNWNNNF